MKKEVSDSKIEKHITEASASVPPPAALARLMRKAKTCAFKKGPWMWRGWGYHVLPMNNTYYIYIYKLYPMTPLHHFYTCFTS